MAVRLIEVVVVMMAAASWLEMAVNAANYQRHGDDTIAGSRRTKRSERGIYQWSQWFNSDSPMDGEGDFETSDAVEKTQAICNIGGTIEEAECRIAGTNETFDSTTTAYVDDNLFQACSSHGLICLNIQQVLGMCDDYEVRFLCRDVTSDGDDSDSLFPNFDFKIYIILAVVPVLVVAVRIFWSCFCKDRLKRRRQQQQQQRRRRGHSGRSDSTESSGTLTPSPSQASFDSTLALPPPSYTDLFGAHRHSGVFTISQGNSGGVAGGEGKCRACGKGILSPGAATDAAAPSPPPPATGTAATTTTTTATATTATDGGNNGSAAGVGSRRGLRRIYSFSGPSGATYLALEDPGFPGDSSTDGPEQVSGPPPARGTRLRRIVSFSAPSGATLLTLAEPVFPVCSSSVTDNAGASDPDDVLLDSDEAAGKGSDGAAPQQSPNVTVRVPLSSTDSTSGPTGVGGGGGVNPAGAPCACACHTQAQQQGHVNLAFAWESCDLADSADTRARPPGMHRPVFEFSRIGSVTSFTSFTSFTEPPDYEEALEILRKSGLLVNEEKVAV